jgi:hypothetical protein
MSQGCHVPVGSITDARPVARFQSNDDRKPSTPPPCPAMGWPFIVMIPSRSLASVGLPGQRVGKWLQWRGPGEAERASRRGTGRDRRRWCRGRPLAADRQGSITAVAAAEARAEASDLRAARAEEAARDAVAHATETEAAMRGKVDEIATVEAAMEIRQPASRQCRATTRGRSGPRCRPSANATTSAIRNFTNSWLS